MALQEKRTYIVTGPELVDPLGFRILRRKHGLVVGRSIVDMTSSLPRHYNIYSSFSSSSSLRPQRPRRNHHVLLARVVVFTASERNRRFQIAAAGSLASFLLLLLA